jgi:hypothetical protein
MASFIRTIQRGEKPEYINDILARSNHHIPLKIEPKRARPGDFIDLAYDGEIVGRARIKEIARSSGTAPITSEQNSLRAQSSYSVPGRLAEAAEIHSFQG